MLPAIDCAHLVEKLPAFWPRGGPSWDGVATAQRVEEESAVILLEAKANVAEFGRGARRATRQASVKLIDQSLASARQSLQATGAPQAWVGPDYQLANRLGWTLWLREAGVAAFFIHLLFEDDRSYQPTSGELLANRAAQAHETLGVPSAAISGWAATVVMPAIP